MTVVPFQKPANDGAAPKHPPMFNVPPLTLGVLVAIIVLQFLQTITPDAYQHVWYDFAFVPARYWVLPDGWPYALAAPFTHMFIHGGWLHVIMNGVMFLAFGAAAERMLGQKRATILFIVSGLVGALAQFALAPHSPYPMVGASGAMSGLFAAVIMRLMDAGRMPAGRFGIWGVAAIWIGLSFASTFLSGSLGIGNVAWAAHAGGFFAGIIMMRTVFK